MHQTLADHEGDGPVFASSGLLEACILLALEEQPAYGYELKRHLDELGLRAVDRARIYRALRTMEGQGLVRSRWDTASRGPARRTYELESRGRERLESEVVAVRRQRRHLTRLLSRYERVSRSRSRAAAVA